MTKIKTAIITGASSGIGEATAKLFAKGGWKLVLTARRKEKLEKLSVQLKNDFGSEVFILQQDVRQADSGDMLANFLHHNNIKPDLLINNAGLAVGTNPIQQGIVDDWERMIDTNLKGLLYISRAISSLMITQGFGHIINIGSIAGKEAYPAVMFIAPQNMPSKGSPKQCG